ncbi:cytochrome P450 [Streptomyces sp. NPDC006274]|uniref:cytochrome P450 n=1 Tax=unclassified Streptomyces TaxID=2593676 RepID=UPI0033A0A47A
MPDDAGGQDPAVQGPRARRDELVLFGGRLLGLGEAAVPASPPASRSPRAMSTSRSCRSLSSFRRRGPPVRPRRPAPRPGGSFLTGRPAARAFRGRKIPVTRGVLCCPLPKATAFFPVLSIGIPCPALCEKRLTTGIGMAGTASSALPTRRIRHDSGVLSSPTAPRVRVPVVGDLLRLRANLLNAVQYAASAGSEVSHFQAGPKSIFFVNRSSAADAVLSDIHTFGKPDGENPLRLVLGDGLISNPDHDDWLRRRRALHPMYSRASLAGMRPRMATVIADRTRRWERQDRTELNVHEEMLGVALDSVSISMFSRYGDTVSDIITPRTASFLLDFVERRLRGPFSLPVGAPSRRNREFASILRTLDALVYRLIGERRGSGTRHGDLLDLLLEARVGDDERPLTDLEVRDEVLTTFLAAYETTASALTWVLYLLACYPDIQRRVREEVRTNTATDRGTPGHAEPRSGALLECVINESMRLFPPSPTIPRQAKKDVLVGSVEAPEGALVMLNVAAIQRDPSVWERPDEFIPERFMNGSPGKATYLPFGAGAHMCIGKGFAMMEMGLLVVNLLARFEISLRDSAGPDPMALITLRPRDGFGLTLTRI